MKLVNKGDRSSECTLHALDAVLPKDSPSSTRELGRMTIRGDKKHLKGEWTWRRKKTGQVAEDCRLLLLSCFDFQ